MKVITGILIFALFPNSAGASAVPGAHAAGVVPEVGRWEGITDQGYPISFIVSAGGSVFEPDAYGVDFDCPTTGVQFWGFSFALVEILILDGRFEFTQFLDSPNQITPGARYVLRWEGQFTTSTQCHGTLDNGIAVFTGEGVGTEVCPLPGITWRANWVGTVSPEELEEYRSRESDTVGPLSESRSEDVHDVDSLRRASSTDDDESVAGIIPRDGYWSGTTSQDLFLEFNVDNAGSTFVPEEFQVYITCPSSPYQSWGFGFTDFEAPIEEGRFEFLFNMDTSRRITPGLSFALRWRGEFISETMCRGTMDAGISVFTGEGLNSEACLERPVTWTATWRNP